MTDRVTRVLADPKVREAAREVALIRDSLPFVEVAQRIERFTAAILSVPPGETPNHDTRFWVVPQVDGSFAVMREKNEPDGQYLIVARFEDPSPLPEAVSDLARRVEEAREALSVRVFSCYDVVALVNALLEAQTRLTEARCRGEREALEKARGGLRVIAEERHKYMTARDVAEVTLIEVSRLAAPPTEEKKP